MEVRADSSTRMLRAPGFILVNVTPNANVRTRKGCTISPQKVRLWFIVVGLWPACTLLAGCLTTLSSLPYWDTVVFSNHAVPLDFLQLLGHSESEQNLDVFCYWLYGLSQLFTIPGTYSSFKNCSPCKREGSGCISSLELWRVSFLLLVKAT